MSRLLHHVATSVLLVSAAACASIPLPDVGGREIPDLERKRVVAKQESAELVAVDGTRYTAGSGKFERVQVGDIASGACSSGPIHQLPRGSVLGRRFEPTEM